MKVSEPAGVGDEKRALFFLHVKYNDGTNWKLHYVSAREMYNIAVAAMQGASGDPHEFRDYLLPPPPVTQTT